MLSGFSDTVNQRWEEPLTETKPFSISKQDSTRFGSLGDAEIQKAARPLAQSDPLVRSYCTP